LIFLISGIDHPNNLRFFNEVIAEKKKMKFFSIKEGTTYFIGLITPVLAAFIIKYWGSRTCFLIDGGTYVLSCLPWLILKKNQQTVKLLPEKKVVNWFIGFKLLIKDQNIRILNISRLLNNLAYVTWTTSLPLLIARIANRDTDLFAQKQGLSVSLVSGGFLLASLLGTLFAKHQKLMTMIVWGSSLLGFSSVVLLALALFKSEILYISAFLLGVGTYCFRISGMTLGQAFTPEKVLGSVIVAGDTVVRGWSFFISLLAVGIFGLNETWELSIPAFGAFLIIPAGFSLLSPLLLGNLAKTFVTRNQVEENRTSI